MKRGKWFLFILISIFLFGNSFAIPESLTIHGRLTNSEGEQITGTEDMAFVIYSAYEGGTGLWNSSWMSVSLDDYGVYNVVLSGINLNFSGDYYLGITVSGDDEMEPRINLTSSPYSFRANTTDFLDSSRAYEMQNLTLYNKISFNLGSYIQSIGGNILKIGGELEVDGNVTAKFFKGNLTEVNFVGPISFGGGFPEDGTTIEDGEIWTQRLYVYNITSMEINQLYVNGSIFTDFDDLFDIGQPDSRFRNLFLSGNAVINGSVIVNGVNASTWLYNQTTAILDYVATNYYNQSYIDELGLGGEGASEAWVESNYYNKTYLNSNLSGIHSLIEGIEAGNYDDSWINDTFYKKTQVLNFGYYNSSNFSSSNIVFKNQNNDFGNYVQTFNKTLLVVNASSERVGFGTANPLTKVHISTGSDDGLQLSDRDTGEVYAKLYSNSDNRGYLDLSQNGVIRVRLTAGSATDSYFTGGNVGIGTNSPKEKLSVAGNASVTNLGVGTFPSINNSIEVLNNVTNNNSYGINVYRNVTSNINVGGGIISMVDVYAPGAFNQVRGGMNFLRLYSGNVSSAYVSRSNLQASGGGAINSFLYAGVYSNGTGGDWTNITHRYGVHMSGEDKNYFSGKIGIGTTNPLAGLHVSHSGGILVNGTFGEGESVVSGPGTRLMWNPKTAAFRGGYVGSDSWDEENLGVFSFGFGINSKASGNNSFALGPSTVSSGESSFALGPSTESSGSASFALGFNNLASGDYSFALGSNNLASGDYSSAMGYNASAINTNSFVIGLTGNNCRSTAAHGFTVCSGLVNFTGGSFYLSEGLPSASGTPLVWSSTTGQVTQYSSSRKYKVDIDYEGINTSKLYELKPVSFSYKEHPDDRLFGFIAEDVLLVDPELVLYNSEGEPDALKIFSFIALNTKTIQELQKEIINLKTENELIKSELCRENSIYSFC
jgi:hypothetical protein